MEPTVVALKLKEIVGRIMGIPYEGISDSSTFAEDLGLDSLAILEVVVDVETSFKLRISEEQARSIRCIQDGVDFILQNVCAEVA
jgi:acyl carrier protein